MGTPVTTSLERLGTVTRSGGCQFGRGVSSQSRELGDVGGGSRMVWQAGVFFFWSFVHGESFPKVRAVMLDACSDQPIYTCRTAFFYFHKCQASVHPEVETPLRCPRNLCIIRCVHISFLPDITFSFVDSGLSWVGDIDVQMSRIS